MTKRTLIELANQYPHIPITMQLSEIQDTAGLGFWCMLKFLHMQFQFGYPFNDCIQQTTIKVRTVLLCCALAYYKVKSCIVMASRSACSFQLEVSHTRSNQKNICCFRRATYAINCFYKLLRFLFAVFIRTQAVYTETKV